MNLSDFEKAFRALAKATDAEMVRRPKGVSTVVYEMGQIFGRAADDLADQVRAHYDLPPKGAPDGSK